MTQSYQRDVTISPADPIYGGILHPGEGEASTARSPAQMSFFKDNWIWILTPMALILGTVVWMVFFSGPPEDNVAPHQYPMFD